MRTVLLASIKHNRRRYVASALAVVIGVAFIVAVNGLAGALRSGMTADVGRSFAGADWVVSTSDPDEADRVVKTVRAEGGEATEVWQGWASARTEGADAADLALSTVAEADDLRWQDVVEGDVPFRDGQALIGERARDVRGLAVGDVLTFGSGRDAFDVTVTGVADDQGPDRADVHLRPADAERTQSMWVDHVQVAGARSTILDVEGSVQSRDEYVAGIQAEITRGVDVIALLVSLFAAIALGVAILVITNTFAILFAQRSRDFALLRCVGVTRAQLRRSVRVEALVLGVVSSLVGAVIGVALAFALAALAAVWTDALGTPAFQTVWVVGALVIGVLVTVVAAWLPTRAVTRIAPLAALRPQGGVDARSRAGVLRTLAGLVLAVGGSALLAGVVFLTRSSDGPEPAILLVGMLAGGALAFVGILLLGPFIVPALLKVTGRLLTRGGAAGAVTRLATSNSVRNPRRTATTAASLMVGVTLTTAVLTGLSSINRTLDAEMEQSYPLDLAVVPAATGPAKVDALLEAVQAADGVKDAQALPTALITAGGQQLSAVAVTEQEQVLRGEEIDRFEGADLLLPFTLWQGLDDAATVDEDGEQRLVLTTPQGERSFSFGWRDQYGAATVAMRPEVLAEVTGTPLAEIEPGVVWVLAEDGTDATDLVTRLTKVSADAGVTAEVNGDYETRTFIGQQFTVITASVVGLLSVAVVIALIGIGNTLGLSVLERTQENSLLRAMGLTKHQLHRTLAWEGVLLAGVATLLGVAIGLAFAWVGVQVMVGPMMLDTAVSVPFVQLAVVVLVAVVAGILASVVPSRRAGRVSPAEGLSVI